MMHFGVRRLVAINSGNFQYANLDLSKPVHLAAPNNRPRAFFSSDTDAGTGGENHCCRRRRKTAAPHPAAWRACKQRNGEVAAGLRFHFRNHLHDVFDAVGGDGDNQRVSFVFLGQQTLQLDELLGAEGSPVAAVEDENDILIP